MAAELDGEIRLVAGAFGATAERSRQAGEAYGVDPARAYGNFQELIDQEARRPDGIQLLAIVTPNHMHLPVAVAGLAAGLPVISDKPATATLAEAIGLRKAVAGSGGLYAVTYTYTGYPMVREARAVCASGVLGEVRKVVVEYPQGWLSRDIENTGAKQAAWRADPAQSGAGGCIADIGVHAFNILEFVTGLEVATLIADLSHIVPGRRLDDDSNALLRLSNGAVGVLHASQISAGARNGLRIRVWGERGGLDWSHEAPDRLVLDWLDGPTEIRHASGALLSPIGLASSRLPAGHPEGFIEAFANLYRDFARVVRAKDQGASPDLPGIEAGVRGMAFVDRALASNQARAWTAMPNLKDPR